MANNKGIHNTTTDRENDVEELNFSDDESLSFQELAFDEEEQDDEEDFNPAMPGDKPTNDDMAPEILIKENGAGSIHYQSDANAADENLTIVNESEIGATMDESEWSEKNPINKKQ